MLNVYLSQTAKVEAAARNADGSAVMNNRGEVQYQAAKQLPCRKVQKDQEIIFPDQQAIRTTLVYYFVTAIGVDDLIDGKRAQRLTEWVGLTGKVEGYRVEV